LAIACASGEDQDLGMRRAGSILLSVLFVLGLASAAHTTLADDTDRDKPPACVTSWPEARYVVGYDQIVHLYNACDRDAVCAVATDVNTTPQSVNVPKKTHVEVVTFRGAPSGKFIPRVACVLSSQ
jgi:hypothetical protein